MGEAAKYAAAIQLVANELHAGKTLTGAQVQALIAQAQSAATSGS